MFPVTKLDSATYKSPQNESPQKTEYKETEYQTILTRDQVRELVAKYSDWEVELMTNIIFCESSFRADVVNDNPKTGDYSVGLSQINIIDSLAKTRPSEEELKDPVKNIEFAHKLFLSGGIERHWTNCYNKIRD